ncbi:FecR domain-containing protein [Altererythrobacter sp. RZ02]|uniref:FecR domain-containing protein n=1 Tax=Pontixanthobacter rizhaonensis TaxID=2730337 RepID=A0A848QLB1_9SPHN|nr:FecR family protein [Pontixanthobacter rizhaonensis]NMW31609.1 FecR domain-containing protein [Pontixanthobacter rizhaonensis]
MNAAVLTSPKALFLAFIAAFIAVTPAASAPVRVGIAASVVGDVRLNNASIKKAVKIKRRQRLAWGDTVQTKSKSKVQIMLLDRSTLTLASNARLTINKFVYDPGKSRSTSATVSTGAFRFMSGRRTKKSSAKVNTTTGSIGIRGTVVDGIVGKRAAKIAKDEPFLDGVDSDKDTATLIVLRGPGAATAGGLDVGLADVTAAGETVSLTEPALAAYIPRPGAPPIGPFRLSQPGLAKVQDELAPRVTNANKGGLLKTLIPAAVAGAVLGAILTGGEEDCVPAPGANIC